MKMLCVTVKFNKKEAKAGLEQAKTFVRSIPGKAKVLGCNAREFGCGLPAKAKQVFNELVKEGKAAKKVKVKARPRVMMCTNCGRMPADPDDVTGLCQWCNQE